MKIYILKPDAEPITIFAKRLIWSFKESEFCVPVDIDELVQNWLDEIFPSYDHFKYHRPKPEFSEYLQERIGK